MQFAAHVAPQRLVDHLMLLDARLAAEALRDDLGGIMVAVARQIADRHVGIGDGELTMEDAENLAALVRHQAAGIVFMPGFRGRQLTFRESPLADFLPIVFDEEKIKRTIAVCAKVQFSTLEKIVQHCAPEDRLKIIFAARTGMRQGETIALKV